MRGVSRPRIVRVDPNEPSEDALAEAAAVLRNGGLVAFPTETVYGLGADACSGAAVESIFAAKGRPADNPLIVHVASLEAAADVTAAVSPLAARLAEQWWPGPLTLVLQAARKLPAVTTGGLTTVAVRVPAHPVALALLHAAGVPLAAPSANRSGRPSPTTAKHVLDDLGGAVDMILDGGPSTLGVESTVVDARGDSPVVLREGSITREMLGVNTVEHDGDLGASPGTRYRHYAPACEVVIAAMGEGVTLAGELAEDGRRVGLVGPTPALPPVTTIDVVRDAAHLAERLYASLRDAEGIGIDVVVVEAVEETGIGRAVMDRLRRAANG